MKSLICLVLFTIVSRVISIPPDTPLGALMTSAITSKTFANPAFIHPLLAFAKHIRYYDSEELGMAVIPKFMLDASTSFLKLGKLVGSASAAEVNHGVHGGPIHHVFPTSHVGSTSTSEHKAAVNAHYKRGYHYHQ